MSTFFHYASTSTTSLVNNLYALHLQVHQIVPVRVHSYLQRINNIVDDRTRSSNRASFLKGRGSRHSCPRSFRLCVFAVGSHSCKMGLAKLSSKWPRMLSTVTLLLLGSIAWWWLTIDLNSCIESFELGDTLGHGFLHESEGSGSGNCSACFALALPSCGILLGIE